MTAPSTITTTSDRPTGAWDGCHLVITHGSGKRERGLILSESRDADTGSMTTLTYRPLTRRENLRFVLGDFAYRWVRRPLRWLRWKALDFWDALTSGPLPERKDDDEKEPSEWARKILDAMERAMRENRR